MRIKKPKALPGIKSPRK